MRKLLIPDISFTALDEGNVPQRVSAVLQLQHLASVPSAQGQTLTIDDIRQRLPVVEKLAVAAENGSSEILLEEEQYTILLGLVRASTWMGVSQAALDLVEAVENAAVVEVEESSG